jgi:hypothetical protein
LNIQLANGVSHPNENKLDQDDELTTSFSHAYEALSRNHRAFVIVSKLCSIGQCARKNPDAREWAIDGRETAHRFKWNGFCPFSSSAGDIFYFTSQCFSCWI